MIPPDPRYREGRPPLGPSPSTAVCRGAIAPDVETSAHYKNPLEYGLATGLSGQMVLLLLQVI